MTNIENKDNNIGSSDTTDIVDNKENKKNIWFNPSSILNKGKLLNFVIGARSGGKTYAMKRYVIKKFLEDGSQFVYLRRFKTELKTSVSSFFNDISQDKAFEGVKFRTKGNDLYINGKLAGIGIALTTQTQTRGLSLPRFKTMIFDEFVLGNSSLSYLKSGTGEVDIFLEIVFTLIRAHDEPDIKIVCLANSISYQNPYFSYFNIRVPIEKQGKNCFISPKDNNQAILQLYFNENHKDMMEQTRFGELISGTKYADYSIGNKSLQDNYNFIRPKMNLTTKSNFKLLCILRFDDKDLGIWKSQKHGIHVNSKINLSTNEKIALTKLGQAPDWLTLRAAKQKWYIPILREYRISNLIFYESLEVQSMAEEAFQMLGI